MLRWLIMLMLITNAGCVETQRTQRPVYGEFGSSSIAVEPSPLPSAQEIAKPKQPGFFEQVGDGFSDLGKDIGDLFTPDKDAPDEPAGRASSIDMAEEMTGQRQTQTSGNFSTERQVTDKQGRRMRATYQEGRLIEVKPESESTNP